MASFWSYAIVCDATVSGQISYFSIIYFVLFTNIIVIKFYVFFKSSREFGDMDVSKFSISIKYETIETDIFNSLFYNIEIFLAISTILKIYQTSCLFIFRLKFYGQFHPMVIFLRQELDRMQKVISLVRVTLKDLLLAIDGTIIMNEVSNFILLVLRL